MRRLQMSRAVTLSFLAAVIVISAQVAIAQTESATVSGRIVDPTGASIRGARVSLVDIDRDTSAATVTNGSGFYAFHAVHPGRYRIEVEAKGFKVVNVTGLTVNTQANVEQNFALSLGSVSESLTVTAESAKINTADASVSTVVDRNFAENLPMNGRSFQTLVQLTPGVVVVPSSGSDAGQFSVNGQRAASNYWMVDGVGANIGVSSGNVPGNGFGGTLGSFSTQGGTNSLVSVDALQEFRIQTSTYAPEFGRTPGAQISIATRSGTNQLHGAAFDYVRNDVLDATDWFANYKHLTKPEERQNDFGGTFSGPIIKDRAFFFFSYEGLRLRLPRVVQSTVPDLNARQSAIPELQPFLNAYPFDPKQQNQGNGKAEFDSSFSDRSTLDAYSLRIDHKLFNRVAIFGRYNYSPSESVQRGAPGLALSTLLSSRITTQTATLGSTWTISPFSVNDFRFNYSRVNGSSSQALDSFGGAVPFAWSLLQTPYTSQDAQFSFRILSLSHGQLIPGETAQNIQRQINVVDSVALTKGSHALKFGVDFRRLAPLTSPPLYLQAAFFSSVPSAQTGQSLLGITGASSAAAELFQNWGLYAQDTWRVIPRLTLTYGLRWDLDAAPSSLRGPDPVAVTGYDLTNFSSLAIAPAGTPPFKTTYGNLAPRIGLAYQLNQNQSRETVIRGGFGVFYDLVSSETGMTIFGRPPFSTLNTFFGAQFPFDSAHSQSPTIPSTGNISQLYVFNPNLKLPYTLQWNVAVERALGSQQTVSASYIGGSGKRLLQTSIVHNPPSNPALRGAFVDNTASSNYNALQAQFQRRLSHGLQLLASYTWAHSIDDGSASSTQLSSNAGNPGGSPNANRGPSDFDIRHSFSAGVTYSIPVPKKNVFSDAILRGWSTESTILARSAPPVDVSDSRFFQFNGGVVADVRPDIVAGQPLYLYGANCASVLQELQNLLPGQECPGGKALNPNAFADPIPGPNGQVLQGTAPRNFLRGFGATQWDFAVHRDFPIRESVKLQFRAEMFNVLNHPNFGQPSGSFLSPKSGGPAGFGLSSQTLGQYLGGGSLSSVGSGAFSPLYQIGGPRSIQFAVKASF